MTLALYGKSRGRKGFLIIAALIAVIAATLAGVAVQNSDLAKAAPVSTPYVVTTTQVAPNDWANASNAGADDGNYATDDDGESQGYAGFLFTDLSEIPSGHTILGIRVRAEARSTDNSGCRLGVRLSKDGGATLSDEKLQDLGSSANVSENFGGTTDLWGETWVPGDFTSTNFVVVVRDVDDSDQCNGGATTSIDDLEVSVTSELLPTSREIRIGKVAENTSHTGGSFDFSIPGGTPATGTVTLASGAQFSAISSPSTAPITAFSVAETDNDGWTDTRWKIVTYTGSETCTNSGWNSGASASIPANATNYLVCFRNEPPPVNPTITKTATTSTGTSLSWKIDITNPGSYDGEVYIDDPYAMGQSNDITASVTGTGTCTDAVFAGDALNCDLDPGETLSITFTTSLFACTGSSVTNTANLYLGSSASGAIVDTDSATHSNVGNQNCNINQSGTNNPGLQTCQAADFHLVLDSSGSIGSALGTMKTNVNGLVNALEANLPASNWRGTTFAYPSIDDESQLVINQSAGGWQTGTGNLNTLVTNMVSSGFTPTANGIATAVAGGTNGDPLQNIMLIITDGDPNKALNSGTTDYPAGANSAILQADLARAAGWNTIVVIFGAGDASKPLGFPTTYVLGELAGDDPAGPVGDVILVESAAGLQAAILEALTANCNPSLNKTATNINLDTDKVTWAITVINTNPNHQTFSIADPAATLVSSTCVTTVPTNGTTGPWSCGVNGGGLSATLVVTTDIPGSVTTCTGGEGTNTATLSLGGVQQGAPVVSEWDLDPVQGDCETPPTVRKVAYDHDPNTAGEQSILNGEAWWTIQIVNTQAGNAAQTGMEVTDAYPDAILRGVAGVGAECTGVGQVGPWTCSMSAGAIIVLHVSRAIPVADQCTGTDIQNTLESVILADGTPLLVYPGASFGPIVVDVPIDLTQCGKPTITKETGPIDGPNGDQPITVTDPNDVLWTVTVTNPGLATRNVWIHDPNVLLEASTTPNSACPEGPPYLQTAPNGQPCTLASGQSAVYTVYPAGLFDDNGVAITTCNDREFNNVAFLWIDDVSGDADETATGPTITLTGDPARCGTATVTKLPTGSQDADISLTDPAAVRWTITATNPDNGANELVVTVSDPGHSVMVAGTIGGSCNTGPGMEATCTLPPGTSGYWEIIPDPAPTARQCEDLSFPNSASFTINGGDVQTTPLSTITLLGTDGACAPLTIAKSDGTAVNSGTEIEWTITISNPNATIQLVAVTDTIATATLESSAACTAAGANGELNWFCTVPGATDPQTPGVATLVVRTPMPSPTSYDICLGTTVTNTAKLLDNGDPIMPIEPGDSGTYAIAPLADADCMTIDKVRTGNGEWDIIITNYGATANGVLVSDTYDPDPLSTIPDADETALISVGDTVCASNDQCEVTVNVPGATANGPGTLTIPVRSAPLAEVCEEQLVTNRAFATFGIEFDEPDLIVTNDDPPLKVAEATNSSRANETLCTGTVVIQKVYPDGSTADAPVFTGTINKVGGEPDDSYPWEDAAGDAGDTLFNVPVGDYFLSEDVLDGYEPLGASSVSAELACNPFEGEAPALLADFFAQVQALIVGDNIDGYAVLKGETTTIYVCNEPFVNVTVKKLQLGDLTENGPFTFNSNVSAPLAIVNGAADSETNVLLAHRTAPGSFTFRENEGLTQQEGCFGDGAVGYYTEYELTIDGVTTGPFEIGDSNVNVALTAGQQATLSFLNTSCAVSGTPRLIIEKFNDPDGDLSGADSIAGFEIIVALDGVEIPGSPFTSTGAPIDLVGLVGVVQVTEVIPATGWSMTGSIILEDNDQDGSWDEQFTYDGQPAAIALDFGATYRVNLYNQENGSILVQKRTTRELSNGQDVDAPTDRDGWIITISSAECSYQESKPTGANGQALFTNLPICDDYVVSENPVNPSSPGYVPDGPTSRNNIEPGQDQPTFVRFENKRYETDPGCFPNCPVFTPTPTSTPTGTATPTTPTTTTTTTPTTTTTATVPAGTATPASPTNPPASPSTTAPTLTSTVSGERTPGPGSPTPVAPSTGNGAVLGGSSATGLLAALGLVVLSSGLAVIAMGRRRA